MKKPGFLITGGMMIVLLLVSGSLAKDELDVELSIGWDNNYRPMEWTPVELGLHYPNLEEPINLLITLSASQDGLNQLHISHQTVLMPEEYKTIPLATKIAHGAEKIDIKVRTSGKLLYAQGKHLWDFSENQKPLVSVSRNDVFIGLTGRPGFNLTKFPDETVVSRGPAGQLILGRKLARKAPMDWTGYACLDALVLYRPQWQRFRAEQIRAIIEWVAKGGRLLLIPGSEPVAANHPLREILPMQTGPLAERNISPESLSGFFTSNAPDPITLAPDEPLVCLPMDLPARGVLQRLPANEQPCLYAIMQVGFGRVAVLGFDPGQLPDSDLKASVAFWRNVLNPLVDGGIEFSTEENDDHLNRNHFFTIGTAQRGTNAVMEYLYNIEEMRPLNIWYVIGLLLMLAGLLGPVDYLVLKRYDRLPLTWVTSTGWILLFTVSAYYGVQYIRGGQLQVRAVSVTDAVEGSDYSWNTSYMGIFAPRSDNYILKVEEAGQWWSGAAPVSEHHYFHEQNLRNQKVYCGQYDGQNIPLSLPINIWSMQCLLSESRRPVVPVTAEIRRDGEQVSATITNRSHLPVSEGFILFAGRQGLALDGIPAGKQKSFSGAQDSVGRFMTMARLLSLDSHFEAFQETLTKEAIFVSQGCFERTRAIQSYLAQGAAVICLKYKNAPLPAELEKNSPVTRHEQWVRKVVYPIDP